MLALAGFGLVGFAPAGAPAAAKPIERAHFTDSFTEIVDCGDFTVRHDVTVRVAFSINGRGRDRFPYSMATEHGEETLTNLTTGESLVVLTNFVVKDQRITDNGDGTFTIIVMSSGSVKIYGPDGRLLFSDPGTSRSALLIDHAGTPLDPSDDVFLEDLGSVKDSTGRNDLQGRDFCSVVRDFAV